MKRHKHGFYYTHTKIEKAEELNCYEKPMVFKYWFIGKEIVAMRRIE